MPSLRYTNSDSLLKLKYKSHIPMLNSLLTSFGSPAAFALRIWTRFLISTVSSGYTASALRSVLMLRLYSRLAREFSIPISVWIFFWMWDSKV